MEHEDTACPIVTPVLLSLNYFGSTGFNNPEALVIEAPQFYKRKERFRIHTQSHSKVSMGQMQMTEADFSPGHVLL